MDNEEVFKILNTKCKKLQDWLKANFSPYTTLVITGSEIRIMVTDYCLPIGYGNSDDVCQE